jgi:integrase
MARYQFYLEEPGGNDPTRILLYIHWNGHRLKYPTGCKVLPRHWKEEEQNATGQVVTCKECTHPHVPDTDAYGNPIEVRAHKEINIRMEFLKSAAVTALADFTKEFNRPPEKSEFKAALMQADGKAKGNAPADLFGFINEFINSPKGTFSNRRKRALHRATISRYNVTLRLLKDYVSTQHRITGPVHFSTVDADFVAGFAVFLTNVKGYSVNTVVKYGKTLREFLRRAKAHKAVGKEVNPEVFSDELTLKEDPSDQVYLTPDELAAMYRLDLSARPGLERVRDLFIVGAWTGLRFGDLSRLQPEHVEGDNIRIPTAKTGKEVLIPLSPFVRAIMAKYGGRVPAAVSNQKHNDYLKELAAMVPELQTRVMVGSTVGGIRREVACMKWGRITTHTARRSFATNLYRTGMAAQTIMKVTGHTTEQSFMRYIRLTNEEHADMIAASSIFQLAPLKAM